MTAITSDRLNCFPMKATFKSDPQQSVRWQRRWGNHLRGCCRGPWSRMLWGLGLLLEKGKAITCKPWEPPEEWKLLWADQRESPSLTTRFSSKTLGPREPKVGSREGQWRMVWSRQRPGGISTWKKVARLTGPAPAHKVTRSLQEAGWSETPGWVTWVGFLQLFYRQEDAGRKSAAV